MRRPFYGNTFIKYNNKRFLIELNAFYNGEVSSDNLAPSEQSKLFIYAKDENGKPYSPSWYTLNVKGSYSFNDHLTMNAGIENITNQRYRPYSSGIVAFGTNLIISLRAGL
jgi:hemoglobin/transferrin/lactoferrin receptor protein